MSDEAAALISRLMDINFEFVKGVGKWPSGKEISPPNLLLIREAGKQAESHAEELINEYEQAVKQRDELLVALKSSMRFVQTDSTECHGDKCRESHCLYSYIHETVGEYLDEVREWGATGHAQ